MGFTGFRVQGAGFARGSANDPAGLLSDAV